MAEKTPTQPDPKSDTPPSRLVPVQKISFRQGETVPIPGKSAGTNSLTAKDPTTSEFWTIAYDPRIRHLLISHYKSGDKLDRKPAGQLYIPESWACWTPKEAA